MRGKLIVVLLVLITGFTVALVIAVLALRQVGGQVAQDMASVRPLHHEALQLLASVQSLETAVPLAFLAQNSTELDHHAADAAAIIERIAAHAKRFDDPMFAEVVALPIDEQGEHPALEVIRRIPEAVQGVSQGCASSMALARRKLELRKQLETARGELSSVLRKAKLLPHIDEAGYNNLARGVMATMYTISLADLNFIGRARFDQGHDALAKKADGDAIAQLAAVKKQFDITFALASEMVAAVADFDVFSKACVALRTEVDRIVAFAHEQQERSSTALTAHATQSLHRAIIAGACALALGLMAAVLALRAIIRPLSRLETAMQQAAVGDGDLTRRIPVQSSDEVGRLAGHFNVFSDKLRSAFIGVSDQIGTLERLATGLVGFAEALSSAVDTASQRSQAASTRTRGVADHMQSMSQAIIEVESGVSGIARHSSDAEQASADGLIQVGVAQESSARLTTSSAHIRTVVKEITKIADRTGLLALNASIQASSAGEAGRSFAVVANEIKLLAQSAKTATHDIETSIDSTTTDVAAVDQAIVATSVSMRKISDLQHSIAGAVEAHATTTRAMQHALERVVEDVNAIASDMPAVDQAIGHAEATAKEVRSSSADIGLSAGNLASIVKQFRLR